MQHVSSPVLSSVFAFFPAGRLNVMIAGTSELADAQYVSADFFGGVAVVVAAGAVSSLRVVLPNAIR